MNHVRTFLVVLFVFYVTAYGQEDGNIKEIRLLIRGDDIGSTHAANLGCIESFRYGILRTVEIMVPCPWFMEAMQMINANPDLDVGIHLTLTCEWANIKWRPLTWAESITDSNGYFFPMVWPNKNFPAGTSIHDADWDIEQIRTELRAQIELALIHLPQISHLSAHMGFTGLDPRLKEIVDELAAEFKLPGNNESKNVKHFAGWEQAQTLTQRIEYFIYNLEQIQPGTYIFIDHPAKDSPEMRSVYHKGYKNVAEDREWVTQVFTDSRVKETIRKKNIHLISYKDLTEK